MVRVVAKEAFASLANHIIQGFVSHPVLIILHQETSSPGRIGQALERRGYALDIRRPRFGDPLPLTLAAHAGAVIFGGPMSANDDEDWIRAEIDWISVPLKERAPFLGVCLGAQMLARQLGSKVYGRADERVEIGYHPITPTKEGRQRLDWPCTVYQWHTEGFEAPRGTTVLAESEHFPVQAIEAGPAALGIQFHVELTLAMMHRWTTRGEHRFGRVGAQDRETQMALRHVHDHAHRAFLDQMIDRWLARDGRAQDTKKPAVHARTAGS